VAHVFTLCCDAPDCSTSGALVLERRKYTVGEALVYFEDLGWGIKYKGYRPLHKRGDKYPMSSEVESHCPWCQGATSNWVSSRVDELLMDTQWDEGRKLSPEEHVTAEDTNFMLMLVPLLSLGVKKWAGLEKDPYVYRNDAGLVTMEWDEVDAQLWRDDNGVVHLDTATAEEIIEQPDMELHLETDMLHAKSWFETVLRPAIEEHKNNV
jgi:hypothetical protein